MTIKIIDGESKSPIPYASIVGKLNNGDFTGLGTTANSEGIASVPLGWSAEGVQYLNITSVGYIPSQVNFNMALSDATIELVRDSKEIEAVTVKGTYRKTLSIVLIVVLLATTVGYIIYKNGKK